MRRQSYSGTPTWMGLGLKDVLLAGQTALALVLLVGAGLLQITWRNLDRFDPGFEKDRLLVADLRWEREGDRTYTNSVYRTLVDRVAGLPGVSSIRLTIDLVRTFDAIEAAE